MEQEFHRVKRLPPYVFAEVHEMKARARAAGEDVIDFGMGNPDLPSPASLRQTRALGRARQQPDARFVDYLSLELLEVLVACATGVDMSGSRPLRTFQTCRRPLRRRPPTPSRTCDGRP